MQHDETLAASKISKKASLHNALQIALEHYQAGRLSQAEAIYQQILQAEPNHPNALHYCGMIAYQLGKSKVAVELISKAINANPSSSMYCNLGIALLAQGDLDAAIKSYRNALLLKPDYADAYNGLGNAFKEQGKLDEAVTSYRKALLLKPDYAEVHTNLGIALQAQGNLDAAVNSHHKALLFKPGSAEAHFNMGNALKEQRKLDEAAASYRKALLLKPDYIKAYFNLGITLRNYGKLDDAVASFRGALSLKPDFAEAYNGLGSTLQDQGKVDEAIASYRKALSVKPDFADVLCNLHALLLNHEDMEPSIECMKRAVEINPDNAIFRFYLGVVLDYSGNSDAATCHFDMAEKGSNLIRAKLDGWRYIKSVNSKLPPITGCPVQAFKLGINAAPSEGLVLEFGVRFGASIRQIAALVKQEVHGFDSFEGLPEAWHHEPKGSYSTKGVIPDVPENVTLHAGWFENTLPKFLDEISGSIRFMNIDCDLYSSTKTILEALAERIVPGTIIVFDEYIGNERWREDEFKAFQEAVVKFGWNYNYLCFSLWTKQAVIRIN